MDGVKPRKRQRKKNLKRCQAQWSTVELNICDQHRVPHTSFFLDDYYELPRPSADIEITKCWSI